VCIVERPVLETVIRAVRLRQSPHAEGPVERFARVTRARQPVAAGCRRHDPEPDTGRERLGEARFLETRRPTRLGLRQVDVFVAESEIDRLSRFPDLVVTKVEAGEAGFHEASPPRALARGA